MYFCTTKIAPLMKTKLILLCMIALAVCNMAVAQTDSDRNFEVKKQLDVFNSIYKNLDMMYRGEHERTQGDVYGQVRWYRRHHPL